MPRIMGKTVKEKFKVYGNVFDHFTVRTIIHLSSKLGFDAYSLTPLFIGKEANVFLCDREGAGDESIVLKIYRLETCDFNRLYDHIRFDPRFMSLRKQRRKVIFAWTQREFRNLMKAREAKVRVPTPFAFENNVLAMEFIGDDSPAQKLKDDMPEDAEGFFAEVVAQVKRLLAAGLVHGDLSPFNILNYRGVPVLIDFSQATPVEAENARELLLRDIAIVCTFFIKRGMKVDTAAVTKDVLSSWPRKDRKGPGKRKIPREE